MFVLPELLRNRDLPTRLRTLAAGKDYSLRRLCVIASEAGDLLKSNPAAKELLTRLDEAINQAQMYETFSLRDEVELALTDLSQLETECRKLHGVAYSSTVQMRAPMGTPSKPDDV
jgi:hypothetical protein